jgi:predicted nucleic acid-binding protein
LILVDTSVWIDHLRAAEVRLVDLLEQDEVGCHRLVIQELALGSINQRRQVLDLLDALRRFPELRHDEFLAFVDARSLWGRGLSAVDAQLLGSAELIPGAKLWTRDKRLNAAARASGIGLVEEC